MSKNNLFISIGIVIVVIVTLTVIFAGRNSSPVSKISQGESHEDLGSSSDNDKEVTRMPETDGTQQPSSEQ